MDVSFELLWIGTENVIDRSYGKGRVSFVRHCQLSFKVAVPFCIPISNGSSLCFTSLAAFGVVSVLQSRYSDRCLVVSRCCFKLHFPNDI